MLVGRRSPFLLSPAPLSGDIYPFLLYLESVNCVGNESWRGTQERHRHQARCRCAPGWFFRESKGTTPLKCLPRSWGKRPIFEGIVSHQDSLIYGVIKVWCPLQGGVGGGYPLDLHDWTSSFKPIKRGDPGYVCQIFEDFYPTFGVFHLQKISLNSYMASTGWEVSLDRIFGRS